YEQGVAGEDAVRNGVARMFIDDDADRLGGVPGRGPDLEGDVAQRQPLAVGHGLHREVHGSALAVGDDGARLGGQLQVAAEEVGVQVGLEDALDLEAAGGGLDEVDADVTAR